jgi:sulfur carrier protein ThiS
MTLFEEILENKTYSELLNNLPDDERPVILASLKKFVENFETKILQPTSKILISDDKS